MSIWNAHQWFSKTLQAAAASAALLAVTFAAADRSMAWVPPAGPKQDPKKEEVKTDQVELIFKTGKTVKGTLVSETEATIKVKVNVAGIMAESEYAKADILAINRNLPVEKAADAKDDAKDQAKTDKPVSDAKTDDSPDDSGKVKIYMATFTGEFGRDVSRTPVKQMIEDIKAAQPDILLIRFDQSFSHWGRESPDFSPDGRSQFDVLEQAREIQTFFTENIQRSADFPKKPRMVGWVKKALGGAAFLPFIFPELYYTSDAHHGGIGYLDHLFDGTGDERARQKQYSLRMARAKGLLELGGYDPRLMQAMAWSSYVLSYRLEGGKPVYIEAMPSGPNEFLLTDDGREENRDSMQDILRYKGNDVLTLDAPTAERLGISKGTADTLDDVILAMGIPREYKLIEGKSKKIFEDWSAAVNKAEQDLKRIIREYQQVAVKAPGGYKERTAARGQRKRFLLAMKGILEKYGEAINPAEFGDSGAFLLDIDRALFQIEEQQRLDKPDR
jgi:hypothetical protein